jgi:hypothetical protein
MMKVPAPRPQVEKLMNPPLWPLCVPLRLQVSLFVPQMAKALSVADDDVAGRVRVATQSSLVVGVGHLVTLSS